MSTVGCTQEASEIHEHGGGDKLENDADPELNAIQIRKGVSCIVVCATMAGAGVTPVVVSDAQRFADIIKTGGIPR